LTNYTHQVQEKLYRSFLASDQVKNVLATTKNVLEGLVLLKKLCDHPRLLTAKNSEAVDADLLATWCAFPPLDAMKERRRTWD
jgi:SNF2 family DNA or RNA helicase